MKARLGSGVRFAAVKAEIARRGLASGHPVHNPAAVAAKVGMLKYGKKKFEKLARIGRRRHGNRGK